ncbi:MAG: NAD(P)-dependent oxidoreductase [Cytophagales bacterium]|nr:NAD(P)-dependent oxidoreductase [Armatimonadota bacterium]
MASAFSLNGGLSGLYPDPDRPSALQHVLVTGAAGHIGSYFAQHHDPVRFNLRLMVRAEDDPDRIAFLRPFGEIVTGDLGDLESLIGHCQGMDAVLHLAGDPSPNAVWSSVLENNLTGTYHLFAAAKAAGCRRVVYASSIHAVSGYPTEVQVKTGEPVNPGDLYGVSKCFGEAMARYMAEQEDVPAICLRIGAFQPLEKARDEAALPLLDAFVSHRDLHQLIEKSLAAPEALRFAVFHGLSNNRFKRLDISDARALVGYEPQDDFTAENPALRDLRLSENSSGHNLRDQSQKSGLREEVPA